MGRSRFFSCGLSTVCVRAAALFWAGALLLCLCPEAFGRDDSSPVMTVEGLPFWLEDSVEKSLRAVWEELLSRSSREEERERVLRLVVTRLYPGYSLEKLQVSPGGGVKVTFVVEEGELFSSWRVRLVIPSIPLPLKEWFRHDGEELERSLSRSLQGVPPLALGWGDVAFRNFFEKEIARSLPGWRGAPVVHLKNGVSPELEVTFTPLQPLVLALIPTLQSRTLPIVLRQDLEEGMLKDLAPLVGLPVPWLASHGEEVQDWAGALLGERNVAQRADAEIGVTFSPAQLSRVRVSVESPTYVIQGWVAGYAGSDEDYPELGLHLGRKIHRKDRKETELYGEWVVEANDFSLESRWGLRNSPWGDIWIGGEFAWPGGDLWWRLWADTREVRAPYFWWRYNPKGVHHGGLGWRLNEHFSLELYYDERHEDDRISIRAVGNL